MNGPITAEFGMGRNRIAVRHIDDITVRAVMHPDFQFCTVMAQDQIMVVVIIHPPSRCAVPRGIGVAALRCMAFGLGIATHQNIKGGKGQCVIIRHRRGRDQIVKILADETGFDFAAFKGRMTRNIGKKTGIGCHADNLYIVKCGCHPAQC